MRQSRSRKTGSLFYALADAMGENGEPVMGYEVGHKFEIIGITVSEEKYFEREVS